MRPELSRLVENATRFRDAANEVRESWSGSAFGYHWNLYYGNFERPPLTHAFSVEWGGINGLPPNWRPRRPDEVLSHIETHSSVKVKDVEGEAQRLIGGAKLLQTDIVVALAPLHSGNGFSKEKELLHKLESWDWQQDSGKQYCDSAMRSFPNMTRDSEAIMQGSRLPSHTYYESIAEQAIDSANAISEFWSIAARLLRQLFIEYNDVSTSRLEENEASPPDVSVKYELLKMANLIALGVLLGVASSVGMKFLGEHYRVSVWNSLSTGARLLFYSVPPFFWMGLLVRKYRGWCWGVGGFTVLVAVIQTLR